MITRVDDKLREEAKRLRFAFSCERCAFFEPTRGACALEYPNQEHRERDLSKANELVFCKEFELA